MPVPPAETIVPPTSAWAATRAGHRRGDLHPLALAVLDRHQVALVAHHAAHLEPLGAGEVGETAGVGRITAAARQADVDVDEAAPDPGVGRGGDRRLAVDGDGDADIVAERGQGGEAERVDDLVGDEEVGPETGRGQADRLAGRGARERVVAGSALAGREGRALVGLDVGPQRGARVGRGHRRQVGVERPDLDDQRRRRQIVDLHRPPSVSRPSTWCRRRDSNPHCRDPNSRASCQLGYAGRRVARHHVSVTAWQFGLPTDRPQ